MKTKEELKALWKTAPKTAKRSGLIMQKQHLRLTRKLLLKKETTRENGI